MVSENRVAHKRTPHQQVRVAITVRSLFLPNQLVSRKGPFVLGGCALENMTTILKKFSEKLLINFSYLKRLSEISLELKFQSLTTTESKVILEKLFYF